MQDGPRFRPFGPGLRPSGPEKRPEVPDFRPFKAGSNVHHLTTLYIFLRAGILEDKIVARRPRNNGRLVADNTRTLTAEIRTYGSTTCSTGGTRE